MKAKIRQFAVKEKMKKEIVSEFTYNGMCLKLTELLSISYRFV